MMYFRNTEGSWLGKRLRGKRRELKNSRFRTHCPPHSAEAIATTTMPKQKQNQKQSPLLQQPPLPEQEETGDKEDYLAFYVLSIWPVESVETPSEPQTGISPNWNPLACPPSVEWKNKLLCVDALRYYAEMKTNPATGSLDESHKYNVERKEPGKKEWRLSSQRSSRTKGTNDSTTVESPTSFPGQRLTLGRPKNQVWPIGHGG